MITFLYLLKFLESLFILFLIKNKLNGKYENLFLKPINIALIAFLLIHLIVPIIMNENNFYRYQSSYQIQSLFYANIFSFFFI